MFLKMVGALPTFIYAKDDQSLFVNLFIGSQAQVKLKNAELLVKQQTGYPWKGNSQIIINPKKPASFTVYVRIPGWATGKETPFDLYSSSATGKKITLKVNGQSMAVNAVDGYVAINRTWKKGDKIVLELPVEPRLVTPNEAVLTIAGKTAIAAGPLVYAVEEIDNPGLANYTIQPTGLSATYRPDIANGVNVISGTAIANNKEATFTAIPFYAIGNRGVYPYKVWVKQ